MKFQNNSLRLAVLLSAGVLIGTLQAAPSTSNTNWWDKHGDDEATVENSAPVINGSPATETEVGVSYSFIPTVTDADNDRLKFSVVNRPVWAGFDRKTGMLSGIPAVGDVGTTTGIVIQVSDDTDVVSLAPFDLTVRTATEGSDSDSGGDAGTEPVNNAPEISGTPPTSVKENTDYRFNPTASDPDEDNLFFIIENCPAWAQFDRETGTLSGVPSYTDVGTTSGIIISVSDGALSTALEPFDLTVIDDGIGNGTAELSWTPPTTRTDGSALTDLKGYRIYYGQDSGNYSEMVEVGSGITSHVVEQLVEGPWYFTMTALDGQGLESEFSNQVGKVIDY